MSEKETKQVQPVQVPMDPAIQQKLNRLSVKYNAKRMLEDEFGESLTDFINTANQVIATLSSEIAKYKEEEKVKKK